MRVISLIFALSILGGSVQAQNISGGGGGTVPAATSTVSGITTVGGTTGTSAAPMSNGVIAPTYLPSATSTAAGVATLGGAGGAAPLGSFTSPLGSPMVPTANTNVIDITNYNGNVSGATLTQGQCTASASVCLTQRQNNATVLNYLFTLAAGSNNFSSNYQKTGATLTCPKPTRFEFYSTTGLLAAPQTGAAYQGTRVRFDPNCQFYQFAQNAPVLTIGDMLHGQNAQSIDWDGGDFEYDSSATSYLSQVSITSGGTGCTNNSAVTFSGGGASTAATGTAYTNASTGAVNYIALTSPGVGYTSAPTISVPGCTGFNATAILGGANQIGQPYSICVILGPMITSNIRNITACGNIGAQLPVNPGSIGLSIGVPCYSEYGTFFSNTLSHISVGGAQYQLFGIYIPGTGNLFQDFFVHNGSGNLSGPGGYKWAGQLNGYMFSQYSTTYAAGMPANPNWGQTATCTNNWLYQAELYVNGGLQLSDNVFNRLNLEHSFSFGPYGGYCINLNGMNNTTFIGLHFEDCQLDGNPANNYDYNSAIEFGGSQVKFISPQVEDLGTPYWPGSGLTSIFNSGYGSNVDVDGPNLYWGYANEFTSLGQVFPGSETASGSQTPSSTDQSTLHISNLRVQDNSGTTNIANVHLDNSNQLATYPYTYYGTTLATQQYIGQYDSDSLLPELNNAHYIESANSTNNGYGFNCTVVLSGNAVQSCTVTLGGSGYVNGQQVTFTGGGGSGATGTLVANNLGVVSAVTINNGGSAYTSTPAINLLPAIMFYGENRRSYISYPATLTANSTLVLSDTWLATGTGSTKPTATGSYVHLQRLPGTYANTLVVKDGSGTTLATNSSAAVDYVFSFNGTAWVLSP